MKLIHALFAMASHRLGLTACLLFPLIFFSPCATAGNIFFSLSINGDNLTLTNQGNSSAYYPTVLHLLADGHWEALAFQPGKASPAELLPGEKIDFVWVRAESLKTQSPLEILQPVMVRFYDQDGSGFGQISFFNPPPQLAQPLVASYVGGVMTISPPKDKSIHASWLLWPQEEGINPLRYPVSFAFKQPSAQRIEWHAGMDKVRLNLGAGRPSAVLLHETDQGLFLQSLPGGGLQGHEQRAAWLDWKNLFYGIAAAVIVLALFAPQLMAWRKRVPK
jgi:hypothetical protein